MALMMERVCFSLKREPTPYLPEIASLSHEADMLSEKHLQLSTSCRLLAASN